MFRLAGKGPTSLSYELGGKVVGRKERGNDLQHPKQLPCSEYSLYIFCLETEVTA